ncbi:PAS domain-containing protein [Roseivirga sp. BDSF3-8]|uniref:PAS domain-containing protein n=1 Tax=Roseivirga sp. BDSF3-8 TaxID=3241598 RepID=UPI00353194AC
MGEKTKMLEEVLLGSEKFSLKEISELDGDFFRLITKLVELKRNEEELSRRLEEFQEVIANMANLDFEQKLPVNQEDKVFNYIAISINMLNEELSAKTVPDTYFKGLLETCREPIIITNNKGMILYVNDQLCRLLQISAKEITGQPIEKIMAEQGDGSQLDLISLPKDTPVDLIGADNRIIRVPADVSFLEDRSMKNAGFIIRFHHDAMPEEEEKVMSSKSKLTKKQAMILMEAVEMMDFYSYWKYFVKEPENVRLTPKFELVDQFVHVRDIKIMADRNSVKDATLSSNLKLAMKFLRNDSVRDRYLAWVDENTPLTTFTKKDLKELQEETEYMITARLIERLNKRKNQLKYSRKAELMEKSLKEISLDKGTLTALNQLGVYKIGDLRAWNIKSLAEQNHITRNHLESIKESLRQLGCLYILKESLEE